ncbi:MAG: hypothetical protein R6W82_00100 [bacterium]
MRIKQITAAALAIAVTASLTPRTVSAQEGGTSGWLNLGLRTLSLSGGSNHEAKYDEDWDIQAGAALLGAALKGQLAGGSYGVEAQGWGTDPVSTLNGWFDREKVRLTFGGYNARYVHTTGTQVEDYGLEGLPYDYTRRGRYADLALDLGELPRINLRYDRFRREGMNNQVWNVERERHAALSPVDETTDAFTIATSIPVLTAAVDLSYTLYSLENTYGAAIEDTSLGLDGRSSTLYEYSHLITDEGSLPVMKANVAVPVGPANVRFGVSSSSGSVDKTLSEVTEGIDYRGEPKSTSTTASGSLDRSFTILDAGMTLPLPLRLTGDVSVRKTDYEVDGAWDPSGSNTLVSTTVSTTRIMARAIWKPMRGISVDLGGANISRDWDETGPAAEDHGTITADWVGGFTYDRQEWFKLRLSHRVGDIEDPFTRISPTDRNSSRASLSLMPNDWLTATLGYQRGEAFRYYTHDPSDPHYFFNTRVSDFRNGTMGLRASSLPWIEGLSGFINYTRGRVGVTVPISNEGLPGPQVFTYRDVTYGVVGGLSYQVQEGLDIEADGSWYRATGQWPLYRFSRRLGIAKDLASFTLLLDLRQYSLNQVANEVDDYDATLITFGIRRGF